MAVEAVDCFLLSLCFDKLFLSQQIECESSDRSRVGGVEVKSFQSFLGLPVLSVEMAEKDNNTLDPWLSVLHN